MLSRCYMKRRMPKIAKLGLDGSKVSFFSIPFGFIIFFFNQFFMCTGTC